MARESIEQFSRREPDQEVLDGAARAHALHPVLVRRPRRLRRSSAQALDELDEEAGQPLNRVYYLSTAPEFFPVIVEQLKAGRPAPRTSRPTCACVIEKPFGTDLESARALQQVVVERLPRAPGLPHRPLPGQGDRPERDGVPVRELDVRAGLEPQLHRPRPDHRRRGPRHRHARRLLRPGRRAARPRAEPHAPAARRCSAWSRRPRSRPTRCATRRSRCSTRSRRRRPEVASTVRAQYTRGRRRAARRCRATSRRRASRPDSHDGDLRRAAARGPQLALGRRADLPAHRQAARAQGHRDRRPAQAGAAPGLPVARARSACSPTS